MRKADFAGGHRRGENNEKGETGYPAGQERRGLLAPGYSIPTFGERLSGDHKPRLAVAERVAFPLPFGAAVAGTASVPSPWNSGVER